MADEADDVLVLDTVALEGDDPEIPQTDGILEGDENGEVTVPAFADEEGAAPAPEETSVIRELRRANRDQQKRIAELERVQQPKPVEAGPKPTLESCEWDEDRFEAELDNWKSVKAQSAEQEAKAAQSAEAEAKAWEERSTRFQEGIKSLRIADAQDAIEQVQADLPQQIFAALVGSKKGHAVAYALSKSPAKLKELSELNLFDAAVMIGEMGATVQMTKRTLPAPDRPLKGSAPLGGSADKQLERLEAEAAKTGNRTKVIAYKRELRTRA